MLKRLLELSEKKTRLAVGLMSGTSLDGIDAALVEIEGASLSTRVRLLKFLTLPYDSAEKSDILRLCDPETSPVDEICRMNVKLGRKMAQAALAVMEKAGVDRSGIDFISSHGQTIYHMPEQYATLQIGELAEIAQGTGCITVGDFRPADMAAGGQGAPLVPYVDYLLFRHPHEGRVMLNIGGISNVTVLKADAGPEEVAAYDTGPGNMLIDAVVLIGTGGKLHFDKDGELAARGRICQEWLEELLREDPYIRIKPPKSTGRELYSTRLAEKLWARGRSLGLELEDITATMTAYTAATIEYHFRHFIDPEADIGKVFVGGGGMNNPVIMENLRKRLKRKVLPMEAVGFSSDAKEAVAFAVLGNEFLHGNPNNLPSATGAQRPVIMGKLALP
jgi:anhydro-N-acetylmuramic acid kinase